MQIDVGTIETDLLGGKVKKSLRSKRSGRQDARTTSWKNHFATPEKQAMVMSILGQLRKVCCRTRHTF